MRSPQDDPRFVQILETLTTGETDAVATLARGSASEPQDPAWHLVRLIALALVDNHAELVASANAWSDPPLQMVQALGAVALARQEPSEEALRLGLESAWLPARPLPEPNDKASSMLWRLWEERLGTRLVSQLEPEPLGAGPTADPFFTALLSLLDPLPQRAAHRLRVAVESGLDLAPVRLTLARLLRRAGDRTSAREILTELATATLEAPWSLRVTAELDACVRDEELEAATQVQLELQDAVRTLRRERGLFVSVEDGPHIWMRQVEPEGAASALRELVDDHMAAGWMLSAWIPEDLEDNAHKYFSEALDRGAWTEALAQGRRLMHKRPEDAALANGVLRASLGLRGPAGSIELSQRVLILAAEAPWALRQHAALLWGQGAVEECLGTLHYLEEIHGVAELSPASFALEAACHLVPRFRPGVAHALLERGLTRFPNHPALLEMQARLQLFQGEFEASWETLQPLLQGPRPTAAAFGLALQCLLEGELEGAEALVQRARSLYPGDPLLLGLSEEIAGAAKKAMQAMQAAIDEAPTPMAALENQLYTLRAAYRLSAFEDGLRLARMTQTLLGEPDPRCLEVIYQCLTALEPAEDREDLAEVSAEARRRASATILTKADRLQAVLGVGFHLDPALLEARWSLWMPEHAPEPLPTASPEPTCALLPLATETGFVTLFDAGSPREARTTAAQDWLQDLDLVREEQAAGRLVLAPVAGGVGPHWLRVTTHEPLPRAHYRLTQDVTLQVPSGRVFAGPGEALLGDSDVKAPDPQATPETTGSVKGDEAPVTREGAEALALELGGRFRLLPPGQYRVKVWHCQVKPWPWDETASDPADVVFQIGRLRPRSEIT